MQPPQRCERRTIDGAEDNIVPHSQYAQAIIDLPEVFNNEQSNVDRAGQYTHDSSFHSFILGSDPNTNFVGFYSKLQEKCVLPADTEIGSISPLSNLFKKAMEKIGVKSPLSGIETTLAECLKIAKEVGEYSLIIRPTFTLGGTELGGIAYNKEEFETICNAGLAANITSQVLVKKSLLGWKKYELEVMRDLADNVVIICSIENIDRMGVHTGDSIIVAPTQILTDKEYQHLRDYVVAIIREIGVGCGGSNVKFAVNPEDGEVKIIEMNPRVSRSCIVIHGNWVSYS